MLLVCFQNCQGCICTWESTAYSCIFSSGTAKCGHGSLNISILFSIICLKTSDTKYIVGLLKHNLKALPQTSWVCVLIQWSFCNGNSAK